MPKSFHIISLIRKPHNDELDNAFALIWGVFEKFVAPDYADDGIELQVNARNKVAYKMYTDYGFTDKSINMELL